MVVMSYEAVSRVAIVTGLLTPAYKLPMDLQWPLDFLAGGRDKLIEILTGALAIRPKTYHTVKPEIRQTPPLLGGS